SAPPIVVAESPYTAERARALVPPSILPGADSEIAQMATLRPPTRATNEGHGLAPIVSSWGQGMGRWRPLPVRPPRPTVHYLTAGDICRVSNMRCQQHRDRIASFVRSHHAEIVFCYEEVLATEPAQGELVTAWTFGASG